MNLTAKSAAAWQNPTLCETLPWNNSHRMALKYSFYHKTGWSLTTHPPTGQTARRNNNRIGS